MTHNTTARILLAAEKAKASGYPHFAASLVQFARMDDPARERCETPLTAREKYRRWSGRAPSPVIDWSGNVDYHAGPKTTEELADFDRRDRNGSGCNG